MTATLDHASPDSGFAFHGIRTTLADLARRSLAALCRYDEYRRTIDGLNARSDRILDDMGIDRDGIRAFARKAHYGSGGQP